MSECLCFGVLMAYCVSDQFPVLANSLIDPKSVIPIQEEQTNYLNTTFV